MQYTINQLYDIIHQKAYDIRDIFNTFFGEEHVDLRIKEHHKLDIYEKLVGHYDGFYSLHTDKLFEVSDEKLQQLHEHFENTLAKIYVWWPSVTVTNEHGKSVVIQDLYAEIVINLKGNIPFEYPGFTLNRTTYSKIQFLNDYLHSHIRNIPKDNFTTFLNPCLGQGPIRYTIGSLKTDYDESLWMLFCQELSMYVTVESLKGGPWKRLEQIGYGNSLWFNNYTITTSIPTAFYNVFDDTTLYNFIAYYLRHGHLSISFKDSLFISGMPFYDFIIDISNSFIDYYNKYLKTTQEAVSALYNNEILIQTVVKNQLFYRLSTKQNTDVQPFQHKFVLTFKGTNKYTNIIEDDSLEESTITTLLNYDISMYILSKILNVINFRYKNEYNNTSRATEGSTTTYKDVLYL